MRLTESRRDRSRLGLPFFSAMVPPSGRRKPVLHHEVQVCVDSIIHIFHGQQDDGFSHTVIIMRKTFQSDNDNASSNSDVARSISTAERIAVITATPYAPARRSSGTHVAVIPPMPITGMRTFPQASSMRRNPSGGPNCCLDRVA